MKFANLTVRTKILISFLVIASLVGMIGYTLLHQLNNMSTVVKKDIPNSVKSLVETSHLDGLVQAIQNYGDFLTDAVWNYAHSGDKTWKESYENVAPKLKRMIDEAIKLSNGKDKEWFLNVKKANDILIKIDRQAIAYVDNDQYGEAFTALEVGEYWDEKSVYKENLVNYIDKRGTEYEESIMASTKILTLATEKYDSIVRTSRRSVLLFSISAVLLSVGLGLLLSYLISRQVISVRNAAKKIARGNFSDRVQVKSNDEIGQLASAFNEMTAKLEESYSVLEHKVEERTQDLSKALDRLEKKKTELEDQKIALEGANEGVRYLNVELENKNRELEKLDKLKSDFVSVVSHELRTPLAITKEGLDIVLTGISGELNKKQTEVLTTLKRNIDRLARIVNDVLDLSRIESGKIKLRKDLTNITELIEQICSSYKGQIEEKSLELKVNIPRHSVKIFTDVDKLTQIFTNLISNSIKFTEKGYIEVSMIDGEMDVTCSVSDTGKGIPKKDQAKIFDKFEQVGRQTGMGEKGTGLGLTIVKSLVDLHHGQIWVESEPGMGTTFSFKLPKQTTGEREEVSVTVDI